MANLYYGESLTGAELRPGAVVEVTGDEARHAVRVARLRIGEEILVGNGRGILARGVVESAARERFSVSIAESWTATDPAQRIVLVQALAKGDRDERAIEQATEFGVDAIVPWQADRSVSRWDGGGPDSVAKYERGLAKWRRIAREASKQSLRARVPEVRDPMTLDGLCGAAGDPTTRVIVLQPGAARRLSSWEQERIEPDDSELLLVVGPEGGFSDAELRRLENAGAALRSLGETVLRTSSAGPAAIAVLNTALGRW